MSVKIRLQNIDYALKPGMFASIAVMFPKKEKEMCLPSHSVLFDDNKVFIVSFKNKCDVDMYPVNVINSFNDKTYFSCDSVRDGSLIVSRNNLFVLTALKKL